MNILKGKQNNHLLIYKKLTSKVMQKDKILSDIKRLLQDIGQFSGHDHTILINEYQRNYDVIL